MLKNIVLQHKLEKEKFLSQEYVWREKLDFAQKFLSADLIKVITGPRRAGKSVFSLLLLKDKNFAYLNFDDENLLKVKDYDEIIKTIFEVYSQTDFILFDEIQNLTQWELFVNKLHRRGYNLIVTGSNANLLSQELATALTGRYVSLEILPFSFREFLKTKKFEIEKEYLEIPELKGQVLNYLDEYLKKGGFPEISAKNLEPKNYLETLLESVLFKDVVKRYKVRFSQKLYDLAIYLISNFSSEFSFTKLKNILEFNSVNTVQNYLSYLREAYLVFPLNRFSFKTKEQIRAPRKLYLIDNGLILAKAFQFSEDTGRLMENLVFVEILRRGHKLNQGVFYYKTETGKEIDFVIKENLIIKQLIQVCYNVNEQSTKDRELKSLLKAGQELNCDNFLIINSDYEGEEKIKGKKILFVPLWKWLIEG